MAFSLRRKAPKCILLLSAFFMEKHLHQLFIMNVEPNWYSVLKNVRNSFSLKKVKAFNNIWSFFTVSGGRFSIISHPTQKNETLWRLQIHLESIGFETYADIFRHICIAHVLKTSTNSSSVVVLSSSVFYSPFQNKNLFMLRCSLTNMYTLAWFPSIPALPYSCNYKDRFSGKLTVLAREWWNSWGGKVGDWLLLIKTQIYWSILQAHASHEPNTVKHKCTKKLPSIHNLEPVNKAIIDTNQF